MNSQTKKNTTQTRELAQVLTARDSHDGDGVKLQRVFSFQGEQGADSLDPFLLLDEFSSDDAADYIGGFPDHPHRGFETVTYMLEGLMEHKDHMGNQGQLVPGSVQWMTAASGIIHSEMPMQEEGRMQGFQLWINLPATDKMKTPSYQEYRPEEIPSYTFSNGVSLKAIAGQASINGIQVKGPVAGIATAPVYFDITLPSEAYLEIPVSTEHTVLTYVFEGELRANHGRQKSQPLSRGQMGKWTNGDRIKVVTGEKGARLLLLAALPLNEPVVQYGPFVMNTREEIEQALSDYRSGRLTMQNGE